MLVEINSLDNGSGMNTKVDVYLAYNEKQKLFEPKPYCSIDEDDFFDLLPTKAWEQYSNGKYHFRVSKAALTEKAKTIYSRY